MGDALAIDTLARVNAPHAPTPDPAVPGPLVEARPHVDPDPQSPTWDPSRAVDVRGLTYRYRASRKRGAPPRPAAVDDLTLSFPTGKLCALLGPNGSGKSTLFRVLATLAPPDAGAARVLGLDVARDARAIRAKIGVLFQSPSLDVELTARENLTCHAALYGLGDVKRRVAGALDDAGLADRADDRVRTFSGGMRRKLEVAKALLPSPELLLLDEPEAGLDPRARGELRATLRALVDAGTSVVLTTHALDLAEPADEVALLHEGKLVARGTPDELRGDADVLELTVASSPEDAARRVGGAVVAGKVHVGGERLAARVPEVAAALGPALREARLSRPTLESAFLRLTGTRLWGSFRVVGRRACRYHRVRTRSNMSHRRLATALALLVVARTASADPVIRFDYSYDTANFFGTGTPQRAALDAAADYYEAAFGDELGAITSGGGNSFNVNFFNPGPAGGNVTLNNFSVLDDEVVIFVGARPLAAGVLGTAGPGGFGASGFDPAFFNSLDRGQTGYLTAGADNDTDFGPWGGAATFSSTANWNFSVASGPAAGQADFLSVALHELGHALGFGTSDSFAADVDAPTSRHLGPASVAQYGGPVPTTADGGHWSEGVMGRLPGTTTMQEAAMDPSIFLGTRKLLTALDYAGFADLGWEVAPALLTAIPEPGAVAALALVGGVALRRRTRV